MPNRTQSFDWRQLGPFTIQYYTNPRTAKQRAIGINAPILGGADALSAAKPQLFYIRLGLLDADPLALLQTLNHYRDTASEGLTQTTLVTTSLASSSPSPTPESSVAAIW